MNLASWLQTYANSLLVIATFVLCVITFAYVMATRRLVQHTERASGAAIESARHAACSAQAADRV